MEKFYSVVTSKGQITIPVKIRNKHKLMKGQMVSINQINDNLIVVEFPPTYDEVTTQLKDNLEKQGFTEPKLREMAERFNGNS